jgi:hypothetical protein
MLGTKVNFETRMEKADQARGLKVKDPVRGRYVRVQRIGQGDLRLAEVQVYPAQSYVDPVRYPIAVTKIPAGTGYRTDFFDATVWNDADPANPKHIWVSGNLMYDGQGSSDKAAINIGQGHLLDKTFGMTQGKDIARNWQTSETDGYEVSESGGGGGGLSIANVTVKVTSSQGASWTNDHGTQTSIGDSFVVNGYFNGMDNSPPPGDSASYTAPNKCMLTFRPFYYTGYNENSYGLVQRYTVVSHIVRLDGLDRAADLQNCRDGVRRRNGVNVAPAVADIGTTVAQTGDTAIDVASRATDQNNTDGIVVGLPDVDGVPSAGDSKDKEIIRVADVATGAATAGNKTSVSTTAGGKATIDGGSVVYSPPAAGLTGTDTFYVDVTDGDLVSSRAMITVYPQPVKNGGFETCTSLCTLDGSASVAPWTGSLTANVFLWGGVPSSTHSGSSLAVLKAPTYGGTYTMAQSFAVPSSGTPKLTVWCKAPLVNSADTLTISILDGATEQTLKTVTGSPTSSWAQSVFDLSVYKGRTVTLQFKATGPNDGVSSSWYIDDISLN